MLDGTEFTDKKLYFECQCYADEHTLRFSIDLEEREVFVSTFLNQYHNIFVRVWFAIKYIFGYKCKYGHFDCTILQDKDIKRLANLLNKLNCVPQTEE